MATQPKKKTAQGAHPPVKGARKIRLKALPMFTRQMSSMLAAGMPLVQSLSAMQEQTEDANFKKVVVDIQRRVEGGSMYSEALAYYPSIFDKLYISMMKAGEMAGILPDTCDRVASFLEASNRLRSKVKSSMMYPTVVISVAMILSVVLIMFVVPVFATMFSDFGSDLPGPTQALLDISDILRKYWYIAGSIIFSIVYGIRRYYQTDKGEYRIDAIKLKLPVVGILTTKVAISRFASTFAQLLHSGVQILDSLDIVSAATGNRVIGDSLMEAKEVVKRGESLSSALESNPHYPRMLIHMLSAGEKTGQIDEMMDKVSEFYDDEVESTLNGLTSMIEPLLMVVVGVMIGGIVVAMFLPIFKMGEIVGM